MRDQYILIVDDEPDARNILSTILRSIDVAVETASSGIEAITKIQEQLPVLILLDLRMPDMNGFEILYWLRSNPETTGIPVVIVSAYVGSMQLPQLQGMAVVPKGQLRAQSMHQAVKALLNEGKLPDQIVPNDLSDTGDIHVIRDEIVATLTPRELEILKLIALRHSNDEIASELSISLSTVKTHVSAIFDKMNVNNRREAAQQAFVLRLL